MAKRIVVIGLEFWPHAKFVAEALRGDRDLPIIGAFCKDSRLRRWYESAYGISVDSSLEAVLELKPDIAFISGKIVNSHEYARAAIERSCHVMTTRPIAHTVAAGEQLLEALQQNRDCCATTQYYTRFWPEVLRMLELISNGEIGEPVSGSFVTHRAGPVQELPDGGPPGWWMDKRENVGGGFAAHVIYCMNLATKIFGKPRWEMEPLVALTSVGDCPVEDMGTAVVQYENATVSFDGSWRAAENTGGWAFNILGTRGEVSVDYRRQPTMYQVTNGRRTEHAFAPLDRDQIWSAMLHAFSDAIDGVRDVEVPLSEAMLDVLLLEQMYRQPRMVKRAASDK